MNDLTAPLGHEPNKPRPAVEIPVAKIVALALGLFFAAFVLWAIIAEDRSGGEPIAVAPADLQHFAKKSPEVIAVPQTGSPGGAATTAATLPSAAPGTTPPPAPASAKPPNTVTITIVDGKTGATREVVVAAPSQSESADTTGQLPTAPLPTAPLPTAQLPTAQLPGGQLPRKR